MVPNESLVKFPVTDTSSPAREPLPNRGSYLPFRRISLPTVPTLVHRTSVISVGSFEDAERSPLRQTRPRQARPPSVESPLRRQRRRNSSLKPVEDLTRSMKARKIVNEFHETEKAYVNGLEMIYSHFLVPIIESLETPEPLLDRSNMNSIFSNFIDIWNFHRSFLSALDDLLEAHKEGPLPLSSLLLSHFPYLSLYNPFITAFPSIISSLTEICTPTNQAYNPSFAAFVARKEADPRCGRLKLRDWLLTIVQRCPRYLLLLKDLISTTSTEDPEHAQLTVVHGLVSKITVGLNKSLHSHAETLALLALQRATSGLPMQLISPGRHLVKRGPLQHAERNALPRSREFLLFSDCLIWLASADASWESLSAWGSSGTPSSSASGSAPPPRPPPLLRNRSRSEAELPRASLGIRQEVPSAPSTPNKRQSYHPPSPMPPPMMKRRGGSSAEERWVYKGKVDLVDIDVTVGSVLGEDYRFEILNPEESFVVYADSEEGRDDWVAQIRQAKANLLESLNATNPNSTLTSSSSTNHIRRSLQALPFRPTDDRLATLRGERGPASPTKRSGFKSVDKGKGRERRRKLDHWVPPVWIPDGKTNECMRCGRMFGWRRRRHHCRLCGRCVCSACSGRTFFIAEASGKDQGTKPARACDVCYESVFPVIDSDSPKGGTLLEDTITSLSKLPSWLSMPSIPTAPAQPRALMAIDSQHGPDVSAERMQPGEEKEPPGVIRIRPHQKLRSYHDILEDFEAHERGEVDFTEPVAGPSTIEDVGEWVSDADDDDKREDYLHSRLSVMTPTPPHSLVPSPQTSPVKKREDTVRRRKRYSMPAIALQTTQVMARASLVVEDATGEEGAEGESPTRQRRFSLVLSPSKSGQAHGGNRNSVAGAVREEEGEGDRGAVGRSVAADHLSQLLSRGTRESG